ncbi:MAG: hypothetical protein CL840_21930 [Crocinitomicaceae bacterium]|nr:hypothetical protein [Crocinitomicaceae bacterium]
MRIFFVVVLLAHSHFYVQAQSGITLSQELRSHDEIKTRNYYALHIMQAKQKDVLKGLEKRLESKTKKEVTVTKNVLNIEKVVYKELGTDSFNISVEVRELENATLCYFAIDLDSVPVGAISHPELDIKLNKYLKRFGLAMYLDAIDDEMDQEQKLLKSIEKELRSTYNESDKSENKIKQNQVEIELTKEELEVNKSNRKSKLTEIEAQKLTVASSSGTSAENQETEKQKLSNLEGEYKKLKSEYKKMQGKTSNLEHEIRNLELKKEKSDMHAETVKQRLADQNLVIEKVKDKQFQAENDLNAIN